MLIVPTRYCEAPGTLKPVNALFPASLTRVELWRINRVVTPLILSPGTVGFLIEALIFRRALLVSHYSAHT